MYRRQLEDYLNGFLNSATIKDYCPNGIQIEGRDEIKTIATAVSANLKTIQAAIELEVDALVVHHGIFWQNDPYTLLGAKKNKIALLLQAGISLFAYHLPLDAHLEVGNNWQAARDLNWRAIEPFGLYNGTKIGIKALLEEQQIESLIQTLENYYQHPATSALGGKKKITSVALVSGGAYKEIVQAANEGIDCFITGNFDEPAWSMAFENKIHFLAMGHCATERVGPKALAKHIQEKLELSCHFIDDNNPF